MGGWVALELARRGRARGVIGIGPVGGATPEEARRSNFHLKLTRRASLLFAPVAGLVSGFAPLRWIGFRGTASDPLDVDPEEGAESIRRMAANEGFDLLIDEVAGEGDQIEHNRERFGSIDVPVLVAFGSRDHVLDPRGGARLAEAIPTAEHRALVGIGHSPQLDHPQLVADIILARLRAWGAEAPASV
jgi:pimeloyl-ACP methyl ester carboxylesterase